MKMILFGLIGALAPAQAMGSPEQTNFDGQVQEDVERLTETQKRLQADLKRWMESQKGAWCRQSAAELTEYLRIELQWAERQLREIRRAFDETVSQDSLQELIRLRRMNPRDPERLEQAVATVMGSIRPAFPSVGTLGRPSIPRLGLRPGIEVHLFGHAGNDTDTQHSFIGEIARQEELHRHYGVQAIMITGDVAKFGVSFPSGLTTIGPVFYPLDRLVEERRVRFCDRP